MKKKIIVIGGPTAIGKTELTFINLKSKKVVRLPKKLEEIINKSFEKQTKEYNRYYKISIQESILN